MRRSLPRILAPRPPAPRLHRPLSVSSALHADWRDRLHGRLWGANAAETAAAAAAAAATASGAESDPLPPPLPLPASQQYLEALDARSLRVVGADLPVVGWTIPAFAPTPPLSDPAALTRAVRRAVIEAHTLAPHAQSPPPSTADTDTDTTASVHVTVAEDGSATLLFPAGIEAAIVSGEAITVPTDAEDGDNWMQLRINEDLLFTVVRRVVQLTGRRIPDAVVSKVVTAADLVEYFQIKPKPETLNDVLRETRIAEIPNVRVYDARVRPWDKERMIGRERPFEKVVAFKYPFETAKA